MALATVVWDSFVVSVVSVKMVNPALICLAILRLKLYSVYCGIMKGAFLLW